MLESIKQNNTGAEVIQIGHVTGNVIIHVGRPQTASARGNDRREMGIAFGGFATMFLGVSLATPDWMLQSTAYVMACGLAIVSGIALISAENREETQ